MKRQIKKLIALIFWLAVWQVISLSAGELLVPSPAATLKRLFELLTTAGLAKTALTSVIRVISGVAAGALAGSVLAVLSVKSEAVETLTEPLMTAVKTAPVAAFAVLLLLWMDRGLVPVLISAMITAPVFWSNLTAGIRGADGQLLEMAKIYVLPRSRVIKRIYVPALRPMLRAACRSSLGMGWKAGIAAEILTVPAVSIGRLMVDAKLYLETCDLFAWTLSVMLMSFVIEKAALRLLDGKGGRKGAEA